MQHKTLIFRYFYLGGKLKNSELCLEGQEAVAFVEKFHIDTFFMSASGVSVEKGFLDYGLDELAVKQALLKNATTTFAVIDHTKFYKTAIFKIGAVTIVDGIITDCKIPEEIVNTFEEASVMIYTKEHTI
ncbi:hypothetical protein MHB42_16035 [Lysinibacillus sp. FSL K6-0232]|uniref:hypothetical protein n=1 Tax=Lysinibacillus sp. NPDC098008 TaxID=3364146 RepID=UPI0030FC1FE3